MRLAKFAGKFALFIAGMALLTFISLFVVGAYLATWPIMRVSPRSRRLTSLMELATAAMGAARAYGLDKFTEPGEEAPGPEPGPEPDTDDTEATDDLLPHGLLTLTGFLNWARREKGSHLTDTEGLTPGEVQRLMTEYHDMPEYREGGE